MYNTTHPNLTCVECIPFSQKDNFQTFIKSTKIPYIIKGAIDKWPSRHWTINTLGNILKQELVFRIHPICDYKSRVMETDCLFVSASLKHFQTWIETTDFILPKDNPFHPFQRSKYWCYADYKYMKELFKNDINLLDDVIWNDLGFPDRNGNESTLWIGSQYANTPCHMDTYGFNLVAQIQGRKQWTLFPPNQRELLSPTRIPFEESSIFCELDMKNPPKGLQLILGPGDVLFVPKHWWHHVECLEASISINTWIEEVNDPFDRLKESLARLLVCSLKELDSESLDDWLNPTEGNFGFEENLRLVKAAAIDCAEKRANINGNIDSDNNKHLTTNHIINKMVSDDVLITIAQSIIENPSVKY